MFLFSVEIDFVSNRPRRFSKSSPRVWFVVVELNKINANNAAFVIFRVVDVDVL